MFGAPQPAPEKDLELPLPAGADTVQAIDWNPTGNMLAGGSWDNKARRRRLLRRRVRVAVLH
jgi:hypothetical protein